LPWLLDLRSSPNHQGSPRLRPAPPRPRIPGRHVPARSSAGAAPTAAAARWRPAIRADASPRINPIRGPASPPPAGIKPHPTLTSQNSLPPLESRQLGSHSSRCVPSQPHPRTSSEMTRHNCQQSASKVPSHPARPIIRRSRIANFRHTGTTRGEPYCLVAPPAPGAASLSTRGFDLGASGGYTPQRAIIPSDGVILGRAPELHELRAAFMHMKTADGAAGRVQKEGTEACRSAGTSKGLGE